MDHIKHQRIKTSSKSHFLKKAIQFLLSLSFFSFLLSYSSLVLVVLHSFNFYFSTFSMKLHNYGIDRHYIFLLCNGILVFIVKNSGLINNSPSWGTDHNDVGIKNRDSQGPAPEFYKIKPLAAREKAVMEVEEEEGRESGLVITEEEVDVEVEEEEERQMGQENWFLVIKEEEEEEEEETGLLSAEELNKKCDDFIKKMREGIKFEAQQLVMF